MFSVDLSTREWDGHVVVAPGGELDLADAADVEAALAAAAAAAAREPEIIVDLAAPEFTGEAGASPLPHSRTAEPMTVKDGEALVTVARTMARRDPATVVSFPGCGDEK